VAWLKQPIQPPGCLALDRLETALAVGVAIANALTAPAGSDDARHRNRHLANAVNRHIDFDPAVTAALAIPNELAALGVAADVALVTEADSLADGELEWGVARLGNDDGGQAGRLGNDDERRGALTREALPAIVAVIDSNVEGETVVTGADANANAKAQILRRGRI